VKSTGCKWVKGSLQISVAIVKAFSRETSVQIWPKSCVLGEDGVEM